MKINDRVTTPDGTGTIIGIDLLESRAKRYIVKLDQSEKYDFNPCYRAKELKKIENN